MAAHVELIGAQLDGERPALGLGEVALDVKRPCSIVAGTDHAGIHHIAHHEARSTQRTAMRNVHRR